MTVLNQLLRALYGLLRLTPPVAPASGAGPAAATAHALPATAPLDQRPITPGGAAMAELDIRAQILGSILTTPHGKLADLAPVHLGALERDPLFYGHLAAWYAGRGEVRDHRVLFAAHLLTSDFAELREAGWVLLQGLPPHMVAAAVDHAKVTIGKAPRVLKSAVVTYLRGLEAHPARFDRAALRSRKPLKHLYATLRIAPGARAQRVLFDAQPPEDSELFALKLLARAEQPAEQARIIAERRIPYTAAVGALKAVSPSVLVALVDVMTPQEVINHLKSLQARGGFDSPELKAMIEAKLKAAEADRRVSTLKATRALASVDLDEGTAALLTGVTDRRVAGLARIARPTALFVDKSGSMEQAIAVAKEIAALVGAVCADFRVLAFDTESFELRAAGVGRSAWEQAFRMVKAAGGTSIGAPLAKLARERAYVEQIVIVTDMGENTSPIFPEAYAEYVQAVGSGPEVTIVGVGGSDQGFLRRLQAAGIPHTVWEFKGDFYSLPNILSFLSRPSRAELVEEVMGTPLPRRG